MKQITAILLLGVLLFNLCGYRLVIDYVQHQQDAKLTAQLDRADYADEDLISIKTALSLPYYNATMDFERVDGAIQIDGVEYTYVKRRIVADSLELLCLPNTTKQKLQTAKTDFFKLSTDLQRSENNKKSANIIKSVLLEYCDVLTSYALQAPDFTKQKHTVSNLRFTSALYALLPGKPPEAMLLPS